MGTPWKPADYYYCWWGFGDLPDLNFDLSRDDKAENAVRDVKDAQPNLALVDHLLDATEYWLKDAGRRRRAARRAERGALLVLEAVQRSA